MRAQALGILPHFQTFRTSVASSYFLLSGIIHPRPAPQTQTVGLHREEKTGIETLPQARVVENGVFSV
jgi:hypothetical protein